MNYFEISFLFFAFLGLLLSFFFFSKKKGDPIANRILGAYLLLFAFNITWNCVYWANLLSTNKIYAHLLFTNYFPWISYGPLFYLYIKRVIKKSPLRIIDGLHFLPLIILFVGKLPFLLLNAETKLELLNNGTWFSYGFNPMFLSRIIIVQMLIYCIFSLRILKKNAVLLDVNKKIWLKFFIGSFFGYWIAFTSYFALAAFGLITIQEDYLIGYIIVFFIGMVTYFGFMQPDVFNGLSMEKVIPFIKYKKTGLTKSHSLELKKRVITVMEEDKLFLENDLRLEDLAKSLNLSRHHMSQVINEHFQLSFFDYINSYRVVEAKELLIKNKDLNVTQVAYSVGFNNRVSFYKAFKKFTGTTPTDYMILKSHHAS